MLKNYRIFDVSNQKEFFIYNESLVYWSSHFVKLLLENVPLEKSKNYLDLACGTGVPLIELAQRLGNKSEVYGVDIWQEAIKHVEKRIKILKIHNVKVVPADACSLPFENNFFDYIVSNIGINNFEDKNSAFREIYRVLKTDGKIFLTINTRETMNEFYSIFISTLKSLGLRKNVEKVRKHLESRMTLDDIKILLSENKFKITKLKQNCFKLRFLDGDSFWNHEFIKMGFLKSWNQCFPLKSKNIVLNKLIKNINAHSLGARRFVLTIPIIYIQGDKID